MAQTNPGKPMADAKWTLRVHTVTDRRTGAVEISFSGHDLKKAGMEAFEGLKLTGFLDFENSQMTTESRARKQSKLIEVDDMVTIHSITKDFR